LLERRLYLLDTRLSEAEIACRYPALWSYLEEGCRQGVHKGYICSHRPLWYTQDDRPPPPIVCTYLGRGRKDNGRPFRFIRNRSRATVANVYLAMYPTPALQRAANENPTIIDRLWRMLNQLDTATILGESRVYGGGLHKLEPKELANVPITDFHEILPKHLPAPNRDTTLFDLAAESATAS